MAMDLHSSKTYSTSDLYSEEKYKEQNDAKEYRIIKRYYTNTGTSNMKRHTLAAYPPSMECKGTQPFKKLPRKCFIGYFSSEDDIVIPPAKNQTYYSTKKLVADKGNNGTKAKKAVFDADYELGGLEKIENQSAVPRRSHGYEVARARNRSQHEDDPLRKLLYDIKKKRGLVIP